MHSIRRVLPQEDYILRLVYTTGETVTVDFEPILRRGGVFAPLRDAEFFRQVALGQGGRYIEWPGGLDFCADALWLEGKRSPKKLTRVGTRGKKSTA